jgi:methyl-accepting chemotaxis protein
MAGMTPNPGEEERPGPYGPAHRAEFALEISKYALGAGVLAALFMTMAWLFFQRHAAFLMAGVCALTLMAMGGGLYRVLYHRGRAEVGFHVLLASILVLLILAPLLLPDMLPSVGLGYALLVMLGHLLLGDRGSRWLTGAGVLGLAADIALTRTVARTWFPPLNENVGLLLSLSMSAFILLSFATIARMIITQQEAISLQLQQAGREVESQAAAAQERHERLQAQVQKYVEYMKAVELTLRLSARDSAALAGDENEYGEGDDPLGTLGRGLERMAAAMQEILYQIHEAASTLSSTATEILAATTQQASGINQQSAAVAQTSTTVDELKAIAEQLVVRAQEVADASQRTLDVSHTGRQAVQETINSMGQIKARVEGIAENILALSEQTQQIGEITATVNDIAAQSNMLALNASVEAARAGEHGKGFAVVAVEVRNLAEQSRQATAQIKMILSNIQKATNATVMATEEGTKKADEGVQLAAQAQNTIEQLGAVIDESAQVATQMVAGGQQQASGVEQIALAMENINQATVQSLAGMRQTEKAAQDLSDLAHDLTDLVEQYQL